MHIRPGIFENVHNLLTDGARSSSKTSSFHISILLFLLSASPNRNVMGKNSKSNFCGEPRLDI